MMPTHTNRTVSMVDGSNIGPRGAIGGVIGRGRHPMKRFVTGRVTGNEWVIEHEIARVEA